MNVHIRKLIKKIVNLLKNSEIDIVNKFTDTNSFLEYKVVIEQLIAQCLKIDGDSITENEKLVLLEDKFWVSSKNRFILEYITITRDE